MKTIIIILAILVILLLFVCFALFELFKDLRADNEKIIRSKFKGIFWFLFDKSIFYLGGFTLLIFVFIFCITYLLVPLDKELFTEFNDIIVSIRPELIGAIFDLIVMFLIIEYIRDKQSKSENISNLKNDLNNLKYCYDSFAKIFVAKHVRELIELDVDINEIDFSYLHIGNLKSDNLCHIIQSQKHAIEDISGGRLNEFEFDGIELKYSNCKFCIFSNVTFKNCFFDNVDFSESKFIGCTFINTKFEYCNFTESGFFNDMIFEDASFIGCSFNKTIFQRPNFDGLNLTYSKFISPVWTRNISFQNTNLIHTEFSNCLFMNANFDGAKLALLGAHTWFEDINMQNSFHKDNIAENYSISEPEIINTPPFGFVFLNLKK